MCPHPSLLLVLVLCLGQTIHMQEGSSWSEHSEVLELEVSDEDGSTAASGATPEVMPPLTGADSQTAPTSQNYTVGNCVRIGLAAVVLLILVAILAEAGQTQLAQVVQLKQVATWTTGMDTRELMPEQLDSRPTQGASPRAPSSH